MFVEVFRFIFVLKAYNEIIRVYYQSAEPARPWLNPFLEPPYERVNHDITLGNYGTIQVYVDNQDELTPSSETLQLIASVFPEVMASQVLWSSSNKSVSAVNDGMVTAKNRGTAVITASIGDTQASVEVIMQRFGDYGILSFRDEVPENLQVGASTQLAVTAEPEDGALVFTWTSSDTSILTVDKNGLVKEAAPGTAQITVNADGVEIHAVIHSCIPITSLTVPAEFWGITNKSTRIPLTLEPENANPKLTILPEHSENAQVTVTNDGQISCSVPVDITLTITDEQTGISAVTILHLCPPVTAIVMSDRQVIPVCRNKPYQMNCVTVTSGGLYGNQLAVFSGNNDAAAAITPDGQLTVHSAGKVTITAAAEGGASATCIVTVAPDEHIYKTVTEAAPATCIDVGNPTYYTCDDCGLFFTKSGNRYTKVAENSWIIPATHIHHVENRVCPDCGKVFDLSTMSVLKIPAALKVIESEAFSGIAAQAVVLPDGCQRVESGAFTGCRNLRYVFLNENTELKNGAFGNVDFVYGFN